MRSDVTPMIRLSEYRVPDFFIDHVDLDIALHPSATRVRALLAIRRNPEGLPGAPLVLDGDELKLIAVKIDGETLPQEAYVDAPDKLTIPTLPRDDFVLTLETEINPEANTKLMGLYRSNGVYCTQCEADGFRRITYFLDRPDVMATWRVRMEAEKGEAPLLLCNGNPVSSGDLLGTTRHFAVWEDPHRKPCYLFALVAGDLDAYSDVHTTPSGRRVTLNVYVEKGKSARAAYAMDSLIRSMKWDEEAFGRDYDLDLFNIVAVSDFNMGAMENKGLNIFNDRYILASPETATDQDYHNIEAIVAHEYFHNWTGNRITCRDWFQLCLKEGLTVFRDQEFSSDMRSRAVERIANVQTLRSTQFVEDAGPLSHPVRPQQYKEINNFYTATVYNKGSELIQMIRLLIGPAKFRAGMDLYFERHDGEACTVEQFIACFAEVSGRDFGAFMRWYDQAGTPVLSVRETYDAEAQTYRLDFTQETMPTPGQPDKGAQVIPIRMGLIGPDGAEIAPDQVVVLSEPSGSKTWENVPVRPIPSLLRGFSAPVKLDIARQPGDLMALAAHDPDPFNRWQAVQDVAIDLIKRSVAGIRAGDKPIDEPQLAVAIQSLVAGAATDPAFAALAITLPSEADMAREIGSDVDPEAIGQAIDHVRASIGRSILGRAETVYAELSTPRAFNPDGESAGRRALRARLLSYIVAATPISGPSLALRQFETANNMTDKIGALNALLLSDRPERDQALAAFEAQYRDEPLILDMWFALSARIDKPGNLTRMKALLAHPKFTLANPNRARSLIGAFANGNLRAFHAPDGSGYRLVTGVIAELDARNPQVAARLATAFRTWRTLEPQRRAVAEAALCDLAHDASRSRDLADILERSLAPA
jgi:aminopeptidase N